MELLGEVDQVLVEVRADGTAHKLGSHRWRVGPFVDQLTNSRQEDAS
jgi:hypothetical protein